MKVSVLGAGNGGCTTAADLARRGIPCTLFDLPRFEAVLAPIREDSEIGVLVLGAGSDKGGPGPLVTQLTRQSGALPVPITIVPGELSKERLELVT